MSHASHDGEGRQKPPNSPTVGRSCFNKRSKLRISSEDFSEVRCAIDSDRLDRDRHDGAMEVVCLGVFGAGAAFILVWFGRFWGVLSCRTLWNTEVEPVA